MKIGRRFLLMLTIVSGGGWVLPAAADTCYELRVDGMACPYCAYGIEKKLKAMDGIVDESVAFRLNDGVVRFRAADDAAISEEKLKKLISDAGFTLRSVSTASEQTETEPAETGPAEKSSTN